MPRVKHFLWLLFNGQITTVEYLFSINLGPRRMCIFCNLEYENSEHLFNHCYKTQCTWNSISTLTSKLISFPDGLCMGIWLSHSHFSTKIKAIIALTARYILKARCDAIFRDIKPNFINIARRAYSQASNIFSVGNSPCRNLIIISNFYKFDGPFLFAASVWNCATKIYRGAFMIACSNFKIPLAGRHANTAESHLSTDLQILNVALHIVFNHHSQIQSIFIFNSSVLEVLHSSNHVCSWQFLQWITDINRLLLAMGSPRICVIPRSWMKIVIKLASFGLTYSIISLSCGS